MEEPAKEKARGCRPSILQWLLLLALFVTVSCIILALLGPAIGNIYGRYGGANPFIP